MRWRAAGLGLATLLTAGSLLVAAPAASANSVTCVLDGVTGMFDPFVPAAPFRGSSHLYQFNGEAACQYADTTGPGAGTAYWTGATIASTGEYLNDVCSTGWAFSNWGMPPDDPDRVGTTSVLFDNPNASDVADTSSMIRFTNWHGQMTIQGGSGVVLLIPDPGQSCTGPPGVSTFELIGVFSLA